MARTPLEHQEDLAANRRKKIKDSILGTSSDIAKDPLTIGGAAAGGFFPLAGSLRRATQVGKVVKVLTETGEAGGTPALITKLGSHAKTRHVYKDSPITEQKTGLAQVFTGVTPENPRGQYSVVDLGGPDVHEMSPKMRRSPGLANKLGLEDQANRERIVVAKAEAAREVDNFPTESVTPKQGKPIMSDDMGVNRSENIITVPEGTGVVAIDGHQYHFQKAAAERSLGNTREEFLAGHRKETLGEIEAQGFGPDSPEYIDAEFKLDNDANQIWGEAVRDTGGLTPVSPGLELTEGGKFDFATKEQTTVKALHETVEELYMSGAIKDDDLDSFQSIISRSDVDAKVEGPALLASTVWYRGVQNRVGDMTDAAGTERANTAQRKLDKPLRVMAEGVADEQQAVYSRALQGSASSRAEALQTTAKASAQGTTKYARSARREQTKVQLAGLINDFEGATEGGLARQMDTPTEVGYVDTPTQTSSGDPTIETRHAFEGETPTRTVKMTPEEMADELTFQVDSDESAKPVSDFTSNPKFEKDLEGAALDESRLLTLMRTAVAGDAGRQPVHGVSAGKDELAGTASSRFIYESDKDTAVSAAEIGGAKRTSGETFWKDVSVMDVMAHPKRDVTRGAAFHEIASNWEAIQAAHPGLAKLFRVGMQSYNNKVGQLRDKHGAGTPAFERGVAQAEADVLNKIIPDPEISRLIGGFQDVNSSPNMLRDASRGDDTNRGLARWLFGQRDGSLADETEQQRVMKMMLFNKSMTQAEKQIKKDFHKTEKQLLKAGGYDALKETSFRDTFAFLEKYDRARGVTTNPDKIAEIDAIHEARRTDDITGAGIFSRENQSSRDYATKEVNVMGDIEYYEKKAEGRLTPQDFLERDVNFHTRRLETYNMMVKKAKSRSDNLTQFDAPTALNSPLYTEYMRQWVVYQDMMEVVKGRRGKGTAFAGQEVSDVDRILNIKIAQEKIPEMGVRAATSHRAVTRRDEAEAMVEAAESIDPRIAEDIRKKAAKAERDNLASRFHTFDL